ncbi:MAG: ATP-binding protein [Lysobacteraceae bacterium]
MSLRLWHRLFLAFASVSVIALALFAMLQGRSVQQGFLGYVNRLERERLQAASAHLADAYGRHGDWTFLRGDTPRLLRLLSLDTPFGEPPARPSANDPAGPPGRGDGPSDFRPPRPPGTPPGPPRDGRPFPPPRDAPGLGIDLRPRLLLLDARGDVVAGNPGLPRDAASIPIVDRGTVVGRLLIAPLPRLREDVDLEFVRQQRAHIAWLALSVLLAALLVAWALSRWLLRPVRALTAGTQALAAGEYAARIDATRTDELGALASDFNALASALERHRDARRQWSADIAHELRTPISVLSGEIQALQDGVRAVDAERLASLQAECGRLRSLVEDLYQLSLSEAGALSYRFEPMDLAEVGREAARAHEGGLREDGLLLQVSATAACPLARGDRARLRQLLDNLLANARRYTDRPGTVAITLVRERDGGRLTIEDSAPGVPDAALPHLFERLYRVEPSRSRKFGGAGLGLAICRNIVKAHGGRIVATHAPLGGLRIDITLPER